MKLSVTRLDRFNDLENKDEYTKLYLALVSMFNKKKEGKEEGKEEEKEEGKEEE